MVKDGNLGLVVFRTGLVKPLVEFAPLKINLWDSPIDTRRCCDVESMQVTLIQRCNNVVCPVEYYTATDTSTPIAHTPIEP